MPKLAHLKKMVSQSISGWAVLIVGILLSVVSSIKDHREFQLQKQIVFDSESARIQQIFKSRLESHENILISVRAFLLNAGQMTRARFHKYVEDTQLTKKYPGIQGFGYYQKVNHKDLESHIKKIQKTGLKSYSVWPDTKNEIHYPAIYFAPANPKNQQALGFDISSEEHRLKALEQARDSGKAILTKKILLVYETDIDQKTGLILFLPIYKPGADISREEGRRNAIDGYVSAALGAKEFFKAIFGGARLNLDFEIYDGTEMNAGSLLYDHDRIPRFNQKKSKSILSKTSQFEISGQTFTLFTNSAPLFQKHGSSSYLWILFGGIVITLLITWIIFSTRMQTKDLMKAQTALQEALKTRDEFLSIASHELRTPMTALKLQAQMLKKKITRDENLNVSKEKIKVLVNQMEQQVEMLNRLIEDMLDFTRLRTGNLKLQISDVDLADLLQESINNLADQIASAGYPVPELQMTGNLKGKWDKMRIGQVVTNLLTNAIRYGKQKIIKIKAEEFADVIRVSVSDQGIGISEEDQKKIFGRFKRLTPASEASGLGLGLFISKQIIHAHQGEMWVESRLNEGSTFIFEIPKNREPNPI